MTISSPVCTVMDLPLSACVSVIVDIALPPVLVVPQLDKRKSIIPKTTKNTYTHACLTYFRRWRSDCTLIFSTCCPRNCSGGLLVVRKDNWRSCIAPTSPIVFTWPYPHCRTSRRSRVSCCRFPAGKSRLLLLALRVWPARSASRCRYRRHSTV